MFAHHGVEPFNYLRPLKPQRILFGLLLGVLLFGWAQIFGGLLRLRAAWRLRAYLENEAAEGASA